MYRIGELAKLGGVTVRTVRYYEQLGLLKSVRSPGGQRLYTDGDLVYLKRVVELKELEFSLSEIKAIIQMGPRDRDGSRRRSELLKAYRQKLTDALEKQRIIDKRVDDLSWHIRQLQSGIDWQECPGKACRSCTFRSRCKFSSAPDGTRSDIR